MAAKLAAGNQFTLEDFLEQLQAIRRMGPIGNLLGMMPGMGQMKDAISPGRRPATSTAPPRSSARMTPAERDNPKIINGSRRLRIANGSGVTVSEVNQLVDRFFEARKMMGQMGGMGMPGMRKRCATKSSKNSRKGKKGKKGKGKGRGRRPEPRCRPAPACRRVARAVSLPGGCPASPPGRQMPDLVQAQPAQGVAGAAAPTPAPGAVEQRGCRTQRVRPGG